MRLCSLSASAAFLSFSSSRSCCRKRSSSSWCCNFRRKSCSCCSFRQRSSISSRSCSNSNCRSRSRCSLFFLTLRFSSSISSICRLLDDREFALLGCFLLPCVAKCLEETTTLSSAFSTAPFLVSIMVLFGSLSPAYVDDTDDVWFPQSLLCPYCLIRSQ